MNKQKVFKSFEEYKEHYFPQDILDSLMDDPKAYGKEIARRAIERAKKILKEK